MYRHSVPGEWMQSSLLRESRILIAGQAGRRRRCRPISRVVAFVKLLSNLEIDFAIRGGYRSKYSIFTCFLKIITTRLPF